jgi:hypothetical protein
MEIEVQVLAPKKQPSITKKIWRKVQKQINANPTEYSQ